jgi:site-specific DNA-adenine methylase
MHTLRAFFSFFGSKYRLARYYPTPKYDIIVEPFSGSAGYSLRYPHKQIILNDRDENVATLWDYLIHVSEQEILSLPDVKVHIDEVSYLSHEAQLLIRFWLTKGTGRPRKTLSRWAREHMNGYFWDERTRHRIASQLQYIRHWKISNWSYESMPIPSEYATYMIDPPYQHNISTEYRYSKIDYEHLALWISRRKGQIIVCEKSGATWLPFNNLTTISKSYSNHTHKPSHEVYYHIENI